MKPFYSLLIISLLGMCIYFSEQALTIIKPLSKSSQFIKPPLYMEHFTLGHNELVADALWLRAIQDFDHCERKRDEKAVCNGSWLGEMLIRITELSPKFRMVYALGPMMLSVMIEDYVSALELLDKALLYYPNDWPILYRGAYIYLYDVKDKKKAAEFFVKAGKNGAPAWVFSLASRLLQQSGESVQSELLIQEVEQSGVPKQIIDRMKRKFSKDK
jgi:tetratricopeptide (TPR) repeat protein